MNEAEAPVYFFDTSALVKRYHQEVGTDAVDGAFDEESAIKMISDLSVIECYSAFAKKARTGVITEEDFRATTKMVTADIRNEIVQLALLGEDEKKRATALIEEYGVSKSLRTLDAMQLAVMKKLGPEVVTRVYCADRQFALVIGEEGFSVIDPEEASEVESKEYGRE